MEELKGIFGSDALTYDVFVQKVAAGGIRLANLAGGNYVDMGRHNREVEEAKKTTVTTSKEYTDLAGERDCYKGKYEALVAENAKRDNLVKVGEKTAPDFVEFVYDKVQKAMSEDSKKTFEGALDEVLKASPQYKKKTKPAPVVRFNSGLPQENGGQPPKKTLSEAFNEAVLAAAGRTSKA